MIVIREVILQRNETDTGVRYSPLIIVPLCSSTTERRVFLSPFPSYKQGHKTPLFFLDVLDSQAVHRDEARTFFSCLTVFCWFWLGGGHGQPRVLPSTRHTKHTSKRFPPSRMPFSPNRVGIGFFLLTDNLIPPPSELLHNSHATPHSQLLTMGFPPIFYVRSKPPSSDYKITVSPLPFFSRIV